VRPCAPQPDTAASACRDRAQCRAKTSLLDLALGAEHADTRMAAAERIQSKDTLQKLADSARNKDNGVAGWRASASMRSAAGRPRAPKPMRS
jgi:hypothetical protein